MLLASQRKSSPMKKNLNFLTEINKLKEITRTGWVLRKVKRPETISEHTFRVAFASWLLSQEKKLNVRRAIKIALSHDLCEVYAGDVTPFFYYKDYLPEDEKERKKFLLKWARLSQKNKEKRGKRKFEKEKKSLLKLIKFLPRAVKKEIFLSWLDYEKGTSKEGKFVKQVDKIETLIQAIEYFGPGKTPAMGWWEEVEESTEDPLLLDFLKVIQKKFYGWPLFQNYKKEKNLENILDFILELGKLKRLPRLYWLIREVKQPETVAGHIFTLTIMAWLFGVEKKGINLEKILKMALVHEITAVHTEDTTPYDEILPKCRKERRKILEKMPRLLKKEKNKKFLLDYKKEKKAISKLVLKLEPTLAGEIIKLWDDYRKRISPEARFLSQLNVLAVFLEALLIKKKKKDFSINAFWEWAFEVCDDPLTIDLIKEMEKKFHC